MDSKTKKALDEQQVELEALNAKRQESVNRASQEIDKLKNFIAQTKVDHDYTRGQLDLITKLQEEGDEIVKLEHAPEMEEKEKEKEKED